MPIYNKNDPTFINKFFDLLSKHNRYAEQKYSNKCGKEIFVKRTMNKWLKNKQFVVISKDDTGVVSCSDENDLNSYYKVKYARKHFISISSCEFALGYGDDIKITEFDIFLSNILNNVILGRKDFLNLQFREISSEEYNSIYNLFIDDREESEFELTGYNKKLGGRYKNKLEEVKVKVLAKDYDEAFKKAKDTYTEIVFI